MNDALNEIKKRIAEVDSKDKRRTALKGFYISVSVISILFLLLSLIESSVQFGANIRFVLFFSSIIITACLIFILVVIPILNVFHLFTKPDYLKTAKKIGEYFPGIKDELHNALQLISESSSSYSPQLINAAFQLVVNKTKEYDFKEIINYKSTKKYLNTALSVLIVASICFFVFPGIRNAAYRLVNYNKSFVIPPKFVFNISPGNAEVTKGDNVSFSISTAGQKPKEIFFHSKRAEQTGFITKKLTPDSVGTFRYNINFINSSIEYYASAENIESEIFKITVINRPVITNFDITIIPPSYSKLPQIFQKDNGNLSALPGSRALVSLSSSRELNKALISFGEENETNMKIFGDKAHGEINIKENATYKMLIEDIRGYSNTNPITYSIKVTADEAPTIEMISPDKNIKPGSDGQVPLAVKIKDDFGFSALNLNFRLSASKYRGVENEYSKTSIIIDKQLKEDEVYYVWNLIPLVLAEGETISYFLEVFDNDDISGPKSAKTKLYTIQVPSLDELFTETASTQNEAIKDLEETLKEAEMLGKELQKISDDLKQNSRDISWQEKERLEKAAEKFQDLKEKISNAAEKLNEMQNELSKNNLLSKETLEKYNELQNLLDEFNSEELNEALKRLQDAMQKMMRDNVQMTLEELKANEEYFQKSIERTLNLLKRIQVEQKIEELIKRTEDITNKVDELKSKTDSGNLNDKKTRDELSKRQNDLSEDLNSTDREMKSLSEKMNELKDMPKEEMDKLLKELEDQKNKELSDEAANELSQMKKMQAMQNQQRISDNMQKMNKQLKDMQADMQQANQMQTLFEMMKVLDDLVLLSKTQEDLKNRTNQMSYNSPELVTTAREQNRIQNDLNRVVQKMSALSQKTFTITPEMGKALGQANTQMQQSITSMQNQNAPLAFQFQTNAMKNLNEAASMIKNGMEQMMNGGGQGGGMLNLMQQLQQLSQQQMNLNNLAQMLNKGQLSQEAASQIQRLAQQQEAIRKSLEQMNREAVETGQSKRIAGNLEKILEEMNEVVTNLKTEKIDDNIIKQQERIFSRLLEAQRSINERDFEKERKSNTGQKTARTSPPELILSTEEGRNKLKDELMKAIREGYKKDYEDLIRKYFEALEKIK